MEKCIYWNPNWTSDTVIVSIPILSTWFVFEYTFWIHVLHTVFEYTTCIQMIVFCWCTHWSDSSCTPPGCCSQSWHPPQQGTPGWLATTCCLQIDNRRPFLCLHGTKSQCISILYTFPLKNTSCSSKHCLKIFSYFFPFLGGPKTLTRVTLNLGCFFSLNMGVTKLPHVLYIVCATSTWSLKPFNVTQHMVHDVPRSTWKNWNKYI